MRGSALVGPGLEEPVFVFHVETVDGALGVSAGLGFLPFIRSRVSQFVSKYALVGWGPLSYNTSSLGLQCLNTFPADP